MPVKETKAKAKPNPKAKPKNVRKISTMKTKKAGAFASVMKTLPNAQTKMAKTAKVSSGVK